MKPSRCAIVPTLPLPAVFVLFVIETIAIASAADSSRIFPSLATPQLDPAISGAPPDRVPKIIFFPPSPPPFGTEIDAGNETTMASRLPSRIDELRPFVGEIFYAPLSTYVAGAASFEETGLSLGAQQKERLAAFVRMRDALRTELCTAIAALENVRPAERFRMFKALAADQSPRLCALEKLAEELRADLASRASWYAMRNWRLNLGPLKQPRERTRVLEQMVVRAAAFYQEGLSPAQRLLLRERSMEMEEAIYAKSEEEKVSRFFMFFSPDTARVHLPENLPEVVRVTIAGYEREKAALKQEIADAIYRLDKTPFAFTRRHELSELALVQEPRFTALEETAEIARLEIARLPDFPRARRPVSLPAKLQADIADYQRRAERLDGQRQDAAALATSAIAKPEPEGNESSRLSPAELRAWHERRASAADEAAQVFDREHAVEIDVLARDEEMISAGLTDVSPPGFNKYTFKSLTEFLREQRAAAAYVEYDIAVFEPGLSPEQRRLLFSDALVALDLPLPGPEHQPTKAPMTLVR